MAQTLMRIPYGKAKAIVAMMAIGDHCVVLPEWVVPFHNAARRMGARLAAVQFRRADGSLRFRMLRIAEGWRTGHAVQRMPRRQRMTGRFLAGKAAA